MFQRESAQTLKTLVPVLVLYLGAGKRGAFVEAYRFLLGVGQKDEIIAFCSRPQRHHVLQAISNRNFSIEEKLSSNNLQIFIHSQVASELTLCSRT